MFRAQCFKCENETKFVDLRQVNNLLDGIFCD